MKDFHAHAARIADIVSKKNLAYGDSFSKTEDIIKILFPEKIPVESYSSVLTMVRIFDKFFRICTDKDALGESPWDDICGYALLEVEKNQSKNKDKTKDALSKCQTYHVLNHEDTIYENMSYNDIKTYIRKGAIKSPTRIIKANQCLGIVSIEDLKKILMSDKSIEIGYLNFSSKGNQIT